ncbi:Nucleoporin GLE1 [Hordeum vulgare]|nr:Nucleoporin GLE1 [Hordeum vulgare]
MSGLGIGTSIFGSIQGPTQEQVVTLTHRWVIIKDCAKFKDQYATRRKKGGKKVVADEEDLLNRSRGKTRSKADERRGVPSIALQGTLKNMMSQKEARNKRRGKRKEEQIKIYLELQTKKLAMEEAAERRKLHMKEATKRRKLDIEEASQLKKLEIEATMTDTKAREVSLAFISVDKTNMSSERKAWFANRQKKMFAHDDLN